MITEEEKQLVALLRDAADIIEAGLATVGPRTGVRFLSAGLTEQADWPGGIVDVNLGVEPGQRLSTAHVATAEPATASFPDEREI